VVSFVAASLPVREACGETGAAQQRRRVVCNLISVGTAKIDPL
jgi:hypothetical protein